MKTIFLRLPRRHKQLMAAAADCALLPLAFLVALNLHFEGAADGGLLRYVWIGLLAPAIAVPVFIKTGLYHAIIRYIDHQIILRVMIDTTVAICILAVADYFISPAPLPAAFFAIFWVVAVLYVLASRFIVRGFLRGYRSPNNGIAVAIYGAGQAGVQLACALRPGAEYYPVIFIDDNQQLHRTTIAGIRVHAPCELEHLAKQHDIKAVLLAMPSISPQQQKRVLDSLEPLKLMIKITPPIKHLVRGDMRVQDVRQIEIEDLLSRTPVAPDKTLLDVCIRAKSVFVSGAGGSIGSELCRQIVALSPRRLVLLDISEYALYSIHQELRGIIAAQQLDIELVPFIGSVLDGEKCKEIFKTFGVDTVYHAAAYKHVPMVEHNPIEGIRNNVFGTLSIARAASAAHVQSFVLISTDKAVRPTNVMGATKRLSELILQAFARQPLATRFCMVRFGNVLGSSGSVVPLFRSQIAAGGPITLTHPDITRYFMTIPEAAQLVLQAGSMGQGGDVFVLDMGQPVRIAELATRMVHLSGQEVKTPATPTGSIEIKYVGLRPGEKLYEELLIGSNVAGTQHPLIMRAQEAEIAWPFLDLMLKQLDDACTHGDHDAIRHQLRKMVSEYEPSSEVVDHLWMHGDRRLRDRDELRELVETRA